MTEQIFTLLLVVWWFVLEIHILSGQRKRTIQVTHSIPHRISIYNHQTIILIKYIIGNRVKQGWWFRGGFLNVSQ